MDARRAVAHKQGTDVHRAIAHKLEMGALTTGVRAAIRSKTVKLQKSRKSPPMSRNQFKQQKPQTWGFSVVYSSALRSAEEIFACFNFLIF